MAEPTAAWMPHHARAVVDQLEARLGLLPPNASGRDGVGPTTDADDLVLSVPGAEEPPD
jgi:hypothetical protein